MSKSLHLAEVGAVTEALRSNGADWSEVLLIALLPHTTYYLVKIRWGSSQGLRYVLSQRYLRKIPEDGRPDK